MAAMRAVSPSPLAIAIPIAIAMTLTIGTGLATVACVRDGAPPVAPVEATAESSDGGAAIPLVVSAPPPARDRERCTGALRPSTIRTGPGCTLDEQISHGVGTLSFPCSGDGPFDATFGDHRFQGTVTGTSIVLTLTTELDWQDGCHWQTKQTIRGEWRREAKVHPKLAWSYTEAPIRGPSGGPLTQGCYGSCKANADIEVDELSP